VAKEMQTMKWTLLGTDAKRTLRMTTCLAGLLTLLSALMSTIALGQAPSSVLVDQFTQDSKLNRALWTKHSKFLTELAAASSSPHASFLTPRLGFSERGMRMSGLTEDYQTTGVQSLLKFTAPFTVTVLVKATQGTADPFEIFLASPDLTQFLTVTGNANPSYKGIWATVPNISQLWQLGEQFATMALNTPYRIKISVSAQGTAKVKVVSLGKLLGSVSNLQPGTGPFYLVLGQRIGLAQEGPQVAYWNFVEVVF
jgi:hypothetical protein